MRLISIVLLCLAYGLSAADYVTVVTKDGRTITGYYDTEEGVLTTVKPKSSLRIKPEEVASITPAISPEKAATKGGAGDIAEQLKARQQGLEADRDKAQATARRFRTLAKDSRDTEDAKKLEANALSSDAEARGYQIKIDDIITKLAQIQASDKLTAEPIAEKPRTSEISQMRLRLQADEDAERTAQRKVAETTVALNRLIIEANRNFILTGDLEPVAISASARPTREDNDRAARIISFNAQLEDLRGKREQLKRGTRPPVNNLDTREMLYLFQNDNGSRTEQFWLSYSELKGKPAPY